MLKKTFKKYQPDYVFHLAAQSLVKRSYSDPVYTWETNTIGTLNVLESLKELKKNCAAVLITSDKSYKNLEIKRGYKEDDILGGKDPYSASKASAELAIQSYISSFFDHDLTQSGIRRFSDQSPPPITFPALATLINTLVFFNGKNELI